MATNPFNKGTYNPVTKVYTNPKGESFSYAVAPKGASIIFGGGGGSGGSGRSFGGGAGSNPDVPNSRGGSYTAPTQTIPEPIPVTPTVDTSSQAATQARINAQMAADRQAAIVSGQSMYPVYNRDTKGNPTSVAYFKSTTGQSTPEGNVIAFREAVRAGTESLPSGVGTSIGPQTVQPITFMEPMIIKQNNTIPNPFINVPSYKSGIVIPSNQTVEPKLTILRQLYKEGEGRSLIGEGYSSLTGTINWLGDITQRAFGEQSILYSDVIPYQLKGTIPNISPTTKVSAESFFTPERISELKAIKSENIRTSAIQTLYTAPAIAATIIGTPVAIGGVGVLSTISGAESLFTPAGMKEAKQSVEQGKSPLVVYGLPALSIIGGGLAVRGAVMQNQLIALRNAPALTITKPYRQAYELSGKDYSDLYIKQFSESKIPYMGFRYKPIPFIPESKFTLSGQSVSPSLRVVSGAELISTDIGGYTFTGKAISQTRILDPLTGQFKTISTGVYPIGGIAEPAEKGIFKGETYKAYEGKFYAGKQPSRIRTPYGGIVVSDDKDIINVISGPTETLKRWSDIDLRGIPKYEFPTIAKVKAQNIAAIFPETELGQWKPTNWRNVWSKKGQFSFTRQSFKPLENIYTPSSVGDINKFIGQGAFYVGSRVLPEFSLSVLPVIKPIESYTPRINLRQPQIFTPSIKTITTTTQTPTVITNQVPANVPIQSSFPIQTQITPQIEISVPTQTTQQTPIQPIQPYINPPFIYGGFPIKFRTRKKTRKIKQVPIFAVKIRRRGKYVNVASGLTKGQALAFEQKVLLQNIARTGKIVPMGTKEMFTTDEGEGYVNQALFRTYKQRRGKQVQLPFGQIIQRSSANLQSQSERKMLSDAREMKRLMKGIM